MISIKVPARICFFGDHQDYLGLPVIAGAINRFIHLRASPNDSKVFKINLIDLNESLDINLADEIKNVADGDYFRSCLDILVKKGFHFDQGFDIEISGNIPLNAGLSSSSALVVCWIRFLLEAQTSTITLSDKEIGHLAYAAEVLYFNQPGGLMDQYTIAQRGMLFIDTLTGESTALNQKVGTLIVAESGISKQTLQVLGNAKIYAQNAISAVRKLHPDYNINEGIASDFMKYLDKIPEKYHQHWYAAIYNYEITKQALTELKKEVPNLFKLGGLMNEHQKILADKIQNTPEQMTIMMNAAKNAGALGAKIIGSGGGGCMLAITDENSKHSVISAFLSTGAANAYEVSVI